MELEFDSSAKLNQILEKIQNAQEEKIELHVPENSMVLENPINKEIIKRFAAEKGKSVNFGEALASVPIEKLDDLGFVEGQDVANLNGELPVEGTLPAIAPKPEPESEPQRPKRSLPKFPALNKLSKRWVFAGLGAIFLLVLIFLFLWTLPSAKVSLSYTSSSKDAKANLTANVNGSLDAEKGSVPAKTEEVVKTDTASGKATGKKTVGEVAKGRVTIYNSSTVQDRFFVKGTVLTPVSGEITFTLDDDVTAVKSSGPGSYGKSGANVTATKSGTEGNLAAATTFKVGSVSDTGIIYAQNDTAFSGGTTKTIAIVSDADRKSLHNQLLDKLSKTSADEIKSKNSDSVIVDGSIQTSVSKETFDKNIGEEATDISLSMEVSSTGVFVKQSDLISALAKAINVADGLKVDESASTGNAKLLKSGSDSYQIEGSIKAVLIPDLDLNKVKKNLTGKRISAASKYLGSLTGIKDYSIKLSPSFYSVVGFLPFAENKIQVSLVEEK